MHSLSLLTSPASSATFSRLASVLIASVWQGLLLTAAAAAGLRLLPELSAAARSALWTAVLILVVALPALPLTIAPGQEMGRSLWHLQAAISLAMVAVWAVVSVFRLAQLAEGAVRLHGIIRRSMPACAPGDVAQLLAGGSRRVRLCTSEEVDRPSVAGFLKARILLPPALFRELNEAELAQIVLHETEHLRRYDDWINLLQQLSLAVFPFNPALFWLNRRLALERELACDDGVLRFTGARKAYAACLARVAEHSLLRQGVSLALGVLGDWIGHGPRKPELSERVERILRSPAPGMGRTRNRLATASLLAGLVGATSLLAHSPQLVSFTPAASGLASSLAFGSLPVGGLLPVRTGTMPRPMLVKAVMPAPISSTAFVRSSAAIARPRRRMQARRAVRQGTAARVVLAAWHPKNQRQAVATSGAASNPDGVLPATLLKWPDTAMPRLTPVVFQVSSDTQAWYAAVPVQGGWLVVQL